MPDINSLASRLDAEFSAVADKVKKFQEVQLQEHKQRQQRLDQLAKLFDDMSGIWKPRLELLMHKFGDRVQVKPEVTPARREASFEFQSKLARVRLRFSASTDRDVKKLILNYDLEIIPILMRYTPHAEIEFPIDAVDKEAAGKWMDDRIVDFVQAYFALGENDVYLKDFMVEDPIAKVRFPNFAAAASLEWQGKQFYFIADETRREFAKQHGVAVQ